MDIDWQEFIFNPHNNWVGRLEKRSHKRFSDSNIADEALNYALKKMGENNWAGLNSFQGRSKPGTFLYSILNNHLEDFSRKKFGYPRPPVWIERLGNHWKTLWKRLCLERDFEQSLIDSYANEEINVKEIIKVIKSRVTNCGQLSSITSIGGTLEKDDNSANEAVDKINYDSCSSFQSMDEQGEHSQSEQVLAALCDALEIEPDNIDTQKLSQQIKLQRDQFRKSFQLTPEQLLLLKLKYQHGYKNSIMAKMLKLKEHSVRRHLKSAEKIILQVLQQSNLNIKDFLTL